MKAACDPTKWTLAEPARISEFLDRVRSSIKARDRMPTGACSWDLTGSVAPIDLYSYLKVRFGEPNGLMMTMRVPSIDNFCHWHYTLAVPETVIEIMGLNVRTEIILHSVSDVSDLEKDSLERRLLDEFRKYRQKMAAVKKTFEHWHLIVNPYHRLVMIIDRYLERLRSLDTKNLRLPRLPRSPSELSEYNEKLSACRSAYQEATAISASIQMLAPVMGEAAVNLVIQSLAKPEIRDDRRVMEDFRRRPIDVRVKSLHLICVGFQKPIQGSEEPFKNFLRVMDCRNQWLHGEIDPRRNTGYELYFDHKVIPLVTKHRSLAEVTLASALASVDPGKSVKVVESVNTFVEFMLSRIEPHGREITKRVLEEDQLGYRPEKNIIGVILPTSEIDMVFPNRGGPNGPS